MFLKRFIYSKSKSFIDDSDFRSYLNTSKKYLLWKYWVFFSIAKMGAQKSKPRMNDSSYYILPAGHYIESDKVPRVMPPLAPMPNPQPRPLMPMPMQVPVYYPREVASSDHYRRSSIPNIHEHYTAVIPNPNYQANQQEAFYLHRSRTDLSGSMHSLNNGFNTAKPFAAYKEIELMPNFNPNPMNHQPDLALRPNGNNYFY